MARDYPEITKRGAQMAAISVDPPAVNAGMVDKLAVPFPILSDPDGEAAIKPYGVWMGTQPIAVPAIVAIAPDGSEIYRYVGNDYIDRPDDSDLYAALDQLNLPALPETTETIAHLPPEPSPRSFPLDAGAGYFRGVQFSMTQLTDRMRDEWDKNELARTAKTAERYVRAGSATRRVKNPR